VLAIGLGSFFLTGGDGNSQALEEAGCTVETFASQGARHVQETPEGFVYNSIPATSGPHQAQPDAPAIWGSYDQPVEQVKLIHNLEHGGVVIQYGPDVPAATVDQILNWYREDPNGLLVAPLPEEVVEQDEALANRIALTAWTHLQVCERFSEDAFGSFVGAHRGDGPEPFPVDSLQPGAQ
jgi:Protein of unknown function (DUF3105)